ncbi:DUF1659 domain-containing protein [Ferroacidibacillus organovorans]|uniref:DUF1659 domain-containing protein n=1 Tax=Ferroacidibacillus organovorans TaxID=1765683 RepID=A0A162TXF0_9BACL|nr:DUF1659 domain-containing protein [Ferroacidibacillus organovorans]KYP81215.1 hypothetical protein AYJ22_08255 [Ferroacidibacillus organovorans]OAG93914.1 hypothetical protein AYW79_08225 [Ferroacidibacillus organovorans]OPG17736.1 hypothetical protein B2M26_00710 [Ferroacidibacillus organovorans]
MPGMALSPFARILRIDKWVEGADAPDVSQSLIKGGVILATTSRHLLVSVQIGQNANGKPKLHNRTYPHVDVAAAESAIASVLQALSPLFADPIVELGHVDTVSLQGISATGTTSASVTSGTSVTGTTTAVTSTSGTTVVA